MQIKTISLQFIGLFNELDKYLETVLNDHDEHMNFAHKLKLISQGSYMMSHVVKQYFYELSYLGELRNQLVHGLGLDGQDYVLPTEHAMSEMTRLSDLIINYLDYECRVLADDLVSDIVSCLVDAHHDYVSVYCGDIYSYNLTWQMLLGAIVDYKGDTRGVRLSDLSLDHD